MPWPERQRRAIAAQKMREAKAKGLSDAEARAYVSAFFKKHGSKRRR
jgi:hypothetical protein